VWLVAKKRTPFLGNRKNFCARDLTSLSFSAARRVTQNKTLVEKAASTRLFHKPACRIRDPDLMSTASRCLAESATPARHIIDEMSKAKTHDLSGTILATKCAMTSARCSPAAPSRV
jgi:hypothetical protein